MNNTSVRKREVSGGQPNTSSHGFMQFNRWWGFCLIHHKLRRKITGNRNSCLRRMRGKMNQHFVWFLSRLTNEQDLHLHSSSPKQSLLLTSIKSCDQDKRVHPQSLSNDGICASSRFVMFVLMNIAVLMPHAVRIKKWISQVVYSETNLNLQGNHNKFEDWNSHYNQTTRDDTECLK